MCFFLRSFFTAAWCCNFHSPPSSRSIVRPGCPQMSRLPLVPCGSGQNLTLAGFLISIFLGFFLVLPFFLRLIGGSIGVEYIHIPDRERCDWIRQRVEVPKPYKYTTEEKSMILDRMIWSDSFERFVSSKYPSEKRFGLEGGESLIPGMKALVRNSLPLLFLFFILPCPLCLFLCPPPGLFFQGMAALSSIGRAVPARFFFFLESNTPKL